MNGTATAVASGSYSNSFRVFGAADGGDTTLEATRDPMRKRMQTPPARVGARAARWGAPPRALAAAAPLRRGAGPRATAAAAQPIASAAG